MSFPTADHVAIAIVTAARIYGQDPFETIAGKSAHRARSLAYGALCECFPKTLKSKLSRYCGFSTPASASANLIHARKRAAWNELELDEVIGAVLSDDLEPDEAPDPEPEPEAPSPPEAPFEPAHFDHIERQLIARMWRGGADETTISATLGASAAEVAHYLKTAPEFNQMGAEL